MYLRGPSNGLSKKNFQEAILNMFKELKAILSKENKEKCDENVPLNREYINKLIDIIK